MATSQPPDDFRFTFAILDRTPHFPPSSGPKVRYDTAPDNFVGRFPSTHPSGDPRHLCALSGMPAAWRRRCSTATFASSGLAPAPRASAPGCRAWPKTGWCSRSRRRRSSWVSTPSCSSCPIMLFTLIGGVVADRYDRRQTLMASQWVQLASAATLGDARVFPCHSDLAHPGAVVSDRLRAGLRRARVSVA